MKALVNWQNYPEYQLCTMRHKEIKLWKGDRLRDMENIGRNISDIPCSNILTDMSPRARDIEEIMNKHDLIKIKKFCMAKENNIKIKTEPTIWENIFANDTLHKGLISKIYKELT